MSKYPIRCPKCHEELLTDGGYLQCAPKPSPQPDGEGLFNEIVRAFKYYWRMKSIGAWMDVARAIASRADEGSAQIEAVRKEVGNHEGRIKGIENRGCVTESSGWVEDISEWRKESKRKVESLEKEHLNHLIDEHNVGIRVKPQPAIAQAPDKAGKMHDLIPGESVVHYKSPNCEWYGLFHHKKNNYLYYYGITTHKPARFSGDMWCSEPQYFTWVRDLDLPEGGGQ